MLHLRTKAQTPPPSGRALPELERRSSLANSLSEAVGQVPILRLHRLSRLCQQVECWVKLESCNPGGSIKDKNAVYLVDRAERLGILKPGGTIIEASSGNFGLGLAAVGAARGYRVIIVVDKKVSPTFRAMMEAHGAELVDVPLEEVEKYGSKARIDRAREMAAAMPNCFYPCQHFDPANPEAHSYYTGREIYQAFGNRLDALVLGISTGGQITGIYRYLRQRMPNLKIVAVDAVGSRILGGPKAPYKLSGLGMTFMPPNLDVECIDTAFNVPDALAFSTCHALARKEGLLLGASTGAIVAAGLRMAAQLPQGSRILMINPDRGDRYMHTVYNPTWLREGGIELSQGDQLEEQWRTLGPTTIVPLSDS